MFESKTNFIRLSKKILKIEVKIFLLERCVNYHDVCYNNTVVFDFVEECMLITVFIRNTCVKLTIRMLRYIE